MRLGWLVGAVLWAGVGCKGPAGPMGLSAADRALMGVWQDEGGAQTTIGAGKTTAQVTNITDTDGEVFEVLRSGWAGGHYGWSYRVPSTGYVVEISVQELIGADTMRTTWSNSDQKSGTEELVRSSR